MNIERRHNYRTGDRDDIRAYQRIGFNDIQILSLEEYQDLRGEGATWPIAYSEAPYALCIDLNLEELNVLVGLDEDMDFEAAWEDYDHRDDYVVTGIPYEYYVCFQEDENGQRAWTLVSDTSTVANLKIAILIDSEYPHPERVDPNELSLYHEKTNPDDHSVKDWMEKRTEVETLPYMYLSQDYRDALE